MGDGHDQHDRWARFRFAVIGPLLAAPPAYGRLRAELEHLASQTYTHPITCRPVQFSKKAIEHWFYAARRAQNPVSALRRKVRKDAGQRRGMPPALIEALVLQYADHPRWSYQLHYDNLSALCDARPELGRLPAYATVRRYMKAHQMPRIRRKVDVRIARSAREVRSFEAPHVHSLWHTDFHHCSRNVALPDGSFVKPKLLAVLDDHSRLCCHAQWYLDETAESAVHGLMQAILKRGLPRALMTDNGSPFIAAEMTEGLSRLSVTHFTTLPESPYQNGKQESFFAPVEGRLMAMLEGVEQLTLPLLNEATQAWAELEYNKKRHSELGQTPIQRLQGAHSVGRDTPPLSELHAAFAEQVRRKQRRSDGTITVDGVRFELPGRYRHLTRVAVRKRSWDLRAVLLVDARLGKVLCRLFPLDKQKNADRQRAPTTPAAPKKDANAPSGIAPLLRKLLAEHAATGLPPAYLPIDRHPEKTEESDER